MTARIISEKEARFLGAQIKFGKIKIKEKGTLLDTHLSIIPSCRHSVPTVCIMALPYSRPSVSPTVELQRSFLKECII